VYGTTLKEWIHEEFGDHIMSATAFPRDISHQGNPQQRRSC
jgi:cyanate lyase